MRELLVGHHAWGVHNDVAVGGGSSVKVSTQRRREHPWSKGSALGKLRRSGAHPTTLAPVRQRRGGGGHGVTAVAVLRWSTTAAKGSCSLSGPERGERRLTMRTMAARGVSSPKRGSNGSGASVTRCGHEDEGERGGVLMWPVKERMGGGEKRARR
jgi:hypothetical protein